MNNDLINNALNTIQNELESDIKNIHNMTVDELKNNAENYQNTLNKLNGMTGGNYDELSLCVQTLNQLNDALDKNDFSLLPDKKVLNKCVDYLTDNNESELLCAYFSSLAEFAMKTKDYNGAKILYFSEMKILKKLESQNSDLYRDTLLECYESLFDLVTGEDKLKCGVDMICFLEKLAKVDSQKYEQKLIYTYYNHYYYSNKAVVTFDIAYQMAKNYPDDSCCERIIKEYKHMYPNVVERKRRKKLADEWREKIQNN